MDNEPKIVNYKRLSDIATRFRSDLNDLDFVLLYAFNGTGKTRLSMDFKDKGKKGEDNKRDTLYFNAFTEDLFYWDNDLENDRERFLKINTESNFFNGLKELALEDRIYAYLDRYVEFRFKIDYEKWVIFFTTLPHVLVDDEGRYVVDGLNQTIVLKTEDVAIKISRGEERIFIWCVFLAICELVVDGDEAYNWVKYIYIDDPVSSLDDNNAIAVACDLSQLLQKGAGKIKVVISSHHHLFFNVMYNELNGRQCRRYFLHKNGNEGYTLRKTDGTPFFHHVALLSELQHVMNTGKIKTHHFNALRSILEKTAVFFGYSNFSKCIHGIEDEVLFNRALNLLSHGKFSIYEPVDMGDDTRKLFINILQGFLKKYEFDLPKILLDEIKEEHIS